MVIGVDTRFLGKNKLDDEDLFIINLLNELTEQQRQHQFCFIIDAPLKKIYSFSQNVDFLMVQPSANNLLKKKYWFDVKLPVALKKIKADVFFSSEGFCSLTTKIPQCFLIQKLGFLENPPAYKKTQVAFYKRFLPGFLKKAARILITSKYLKNNILNHYQIESNKIDIIYPAANTVFQTISFTEKAAVKEKYTDGKEFFIYPGSIDPHKNILNLLKAFSLFKKRQRSNWKLVLNGKIDWQKDGFSELIKTYKYREDIVLLNIENENEQANLIASSYAVVHPGLFEQSTIMAITAMQCSVPLLAPANTLLQEIAQDAALYFDANEPADIAEKLMLIYKDENLRTDLIEKGKAVASTYNIQNAAEILWQNLHQAAGG